MAPVTDKQLNTIISGFRAEFTAFKEEYMKQFDEMKTHFQIEMKKRDDAIAILKQENKTIQDHVARLEEKIDDAEAYERRDCVVVSGESVPPAQTGENCIEVSCSLLREKLNLNIGPTDISTAHRMGKKPSVQGPDRRKIILKLCRRDLKKDILQACKQVKPGFFVNESLTPARNTILFALRQMKRATNSPVKGTATIDGRVFVWVETPGASRDLRVAVNTRAKLMQFSLQYMNKPLSEYVTEWP